MKTFDKIAKYYGTDKSSEVHNYCEKYEKWFPFNRLEPLKILEIGVLDGHSLLSWRDIYPNATIVGIDIDSKCKSFENIDRKIYVEIGSQDDPDFLQNVASKYGPFDFILDDGSHMQSHIVFSFNHLFDYVRSEGIYVIEDSTSAYWDDYEGGFRKKGTSVEFCKDLVDDVNFNGIYQSSFWSVHARREDYLIPQVNRTNPEIRTDIESVNFLNGIIIITKR